MRGKGIRLREYPNNWGGRLISTLVGQDKPPKQLLSRSILKLLLFSFEYTMPLPTQGKPMKIRHAKGCMNKTCENISGCWKETCNNRMYRNLSLWRLWHRYQLGYLKGEIQWISYSKQFWHRYLNNWGKFKGTRFIIMAMTKICLTKAPCITP